MPLISKFYGIIICMFYNEHMPPHFHVEYAEFKARRHEQPKKIEPLE